MQMAHPLSVRPLEWEILSHSQIAVPQFKPVQRLLHHIRLQQAHQLVEVAERFYHFQT
jgi:hypothetical protein